MINIAFRVMVALNALGALVLFGFIAIRYPSNHAAGVFGYYVYFGVLCAISIVLAVILKKTMWVPIFLSLALIYLCWFIDYHNVLVDYDEWLARGMPEWGHRGASEPRETSEQDPDTSNKIRGGSGSDAENGVFNTTQESAQDAVEGTESEKTKMLPAEF